MKGLRLGRAGRAPVRAVPRRALRRHRDRRRRHDAAAGSRPASSSTSIWCVLSARRARARRRPRLGRRLPRRAPRAAASRSHHFRDGFFPAQSAPRSRTGSRARRRASSPTSILTHRGDDAHQDHREVSRLTWNTFRDHLILEYEIPKWDGDLGRPNFYVPISAAAMARKIELLVRHFGTQRSKHWFDAETFRGLARLRGMECRAPERYAEAFYARKMTLV